MHIAEALASRRSIRAFQKKNVPQGIVKQILEQATRSPSSGNIQPWQVIVLTGQALQSFSGELSEKFLNGEGGNPEYSYYPAPIKEPYAARRHKTGHDLYESVGISRDEKEKQRQQIARNFQFFGAPVGLLFTMDRIMGSGNWIDLGMFMQSIMLAARGFGLDTCPQASFADYHEYIAQRLKIPAERQLINGMALGYRNGMALGYRDSTAPQNLFETERDPVDGFTRFIDNI